MSRLAAAVVTLAVAAPVTLYLMGRAYQIGVREGRQW